jgi:hypothetical protein
MLRVQRILMHCKYTTMRVPHDLISAHFHIFLFGVLLFPSRVFSLQKRIDEILAGRGYNENLESLSSLH